MKKISRHAFLQAAGAAAVTCMLAGCGNSDSSAPASTGSSAAGSSTAGSAPAADPAAVWPGDDVTVYVASSAGSSNDLQTRVWTQWMEERTGYTFTVMNQTDGGGVTAYELVRNEGADGLSVFVMHSGVNAQYWLGQYDQRPDESFKILGGISATGNQAYVTRADNSDYNNLTEMVAFAKANPGKLRWGVKLGNATHLSVTQMMLAADFEASLLDAGDQNTKLTGVLGNSLDIGNMTLDVAEQYVESGDLKIVFTSQPYKDYENLIEWNDGQMAFLGVGHTYVWCNKEVSEEQLEAADALFEEFQGGPGGCRAADHAGPEPGICGPSDAVRGNGQRLCVQG